MNFYQNIITRRSIRKYTAAPVEPKMIEAILQAAMAAPSAHNEQPWHFVVIRDRTVLEAIPKFHPYAGMLAEAPLAIAVCAEHAREKDPSAGYWIQDCAAATENILLAAHGLGLGACWLGIHPRPQRQEALAALLGLPDGVEAFGMVALGHPAERKPPAQRYLPDRVHHDCWKS
ncbi:MAG: nitroreductase family protein [Sedimentisphaerales bacterium]|nr:nitroreductase family protein [Sedimentisphaerales bacterium]